MGQWRGYVGCKWGFLKPSMKLPLLSTTMSFLWASAKIRSDLESPNTPDALPDMTELEKAMVLPAMNHKLQRVSMWAGCSLVLLHPPVEATEHICSPGSPATKLPHSVLLRRVRSAPNSEPIDFWPIVGPWETTAEVLTGSDPCHWYHRTPPGASRPPGQSVLCFLSCASAWPLHVLCEQEKWAPLMGLGLQSHCCYSITVSASGFIHAVTLYLSPALPSFSFQFISPLCPFKIRAPRPMKSHPVEHLLFHEP